MAFLTVIILPPPHAGRVCIFVQSLIRVFHSQRLQPQFNSKNLLLTLKNVKIYKPPWQDVFNLKPA